MYLAETVHLHAFSCIGDGGVGGGGVGWRGRDVGRGRHGPPPPVDWSRRSCAVLGHVSMLFGYRQGVYRFFLTEVATTQATLEGFLGSRMSHGKVAARWAGISRPEKMKFDEFYKFIDYLLLSIDNVKL